MRQVCCIVFCLFTVFLSAQKQPDLSVYKTSKDKLQAWGEYCDEILYDENYPGLRIAGKKGLAMTPITDYYNLSLFTFYTGITFNNGKEIDSAVYYFEKSELYGRKANNRKRIRESLSQLLKIYRSTGNTDKRETVLHKLTAMLKESQSLRDRTDILAEIADYYISIGQYEKGLSYQLETVKGRRALIATASDSTNFGVALVNVGELYIGMNHPEKGIDYLRESESFMVDYREGTAHIIKDYIDAFLQMDKTEEAKKNYTRLVDFTQKYTDPGLWANVLASDLALADYYISKKQNNLALAYVLDAQRLSAKYPDRFMQAQTDYISGKVYLGLQQYDKALGYLKAAEPLEKKDAPDIYGALQKSLSETYAALGNWKLAYQHFKIYSVLQDTLLTEKAKKNLAEMEAQYQNKKKQQEINMLSAQNSIKSLQIKTAKKQQLFFILGIILIGIIGSLLFYQSRNRKKTNQKLQLLNSELDQANKVKTQFFNILNHDLRSPVANLIHFLHLQKESPELLDAESKQRMENKTIAGAENLLNSMEDILLWSKGQMENFKPQLKKTAVSSLFEDTKNHFSGIEKAQLLFENPENLQLFTDENYLKTIMRNLTGNAIKATEKIQGPQIIWKAWQENGQYHLSITDNGFGGTQEQFKALYDEKQVVGIKTGLGLHLIRDLAKAIDCTIEVKTKLNSGTTFTLSLK